MLHEIDSLPRDDDLKGYVLRSIASRQEVSIFGISFNPQKANAI